MLLAIFLIIVGAVGVAYGVVLAVGRHRPVDLGGVVLSALGAMLALLGVGRLLSDRFLSN